MSLLSLARQSSALQVLTQVRVRAAVVSRVISHRAHQHTTSTSNNSSSSSSNSITPSIVDKKSSASSMMNSPLSFVHVRSLTSEAKCHNDRVTFDFRKEHDGKLLRVVMESEGNNVFTTTNLASLNTRLTRELKNPQVRMMVLESANPEIFSMGLCPHHLLELSEDERVQLVHQQVAAVRRIHLSPVPTLAYISGKCYAAGAVMAAACDVRVCNPN
eukprot:TRINITY_DN2384_c1_g2_i1.p1 TRINITY_DN2384_c1_g2~~TRINITY_DN2384_c1_g2_i1.p1  ORF type:complete len:216 (+),score=37.32 TRINITY_DN2384_c1_g2_i1:320-967(+)